MRDLRSQYAAVRMANGYVVVRDRLSGLQGVYERTGEYRHGDLRRVPVEVITGARTGF
jgi:hypothetical protein